MSAGMWIRIVDDGGRRQLALQRRVTTLGSGEACQLRIVATGVAETHAVIYQQATGFQITRAAPEHRLLVDGVEVSRARLEAGQQVVIGGATLQLEPQAPPQPSAETAQTDELPDKLMQQLERFSACVLAGERWPAPAEILLQSLLELTGAEYGYLALTDDEPRIVARWPRPTEQEPQDQELLSDTLIQQVLQSGEPVVVDDAASDTLFGQAPSIISLKLRAALCLPLMVGSRRHGVLYLGHTHQAGLFHAATVKVATILAAQAALLLQSAQRTEQLQQTVSKLHQTIQQVGEREVVIQSPAMKQVVSLLERGAQATISVLISGETGTGKELCARLVHQRSACKEGPFVAINCAAIPESLLESEFFGHCKGAFTGAEQDHPGLLERADGGTLFLDEVGELCSSVQAKLLRALQEHTVRRVGETTDRPVKLRVVAASNRELEDPAQGFRQDLYYRLAGLVVQLPPLRERPEDLFALAKLFMRRFGAEFQRRELGLSEGALMAMHAHRWPGNVRELENRLRRAVLMAEGAQLEPADLGLSTDAEIQPLAAARDHFVARYVREVVERHGGHRETAAAALGIGLRSLYRYLKLEPGQGEAGA